MKSKTKSDLSDIKRNIDQIFDKITTNSNFTPMVTGIALSTITGITISILSGDVVQHADATHAIFWMRP